MGRPKKIEEDKSNPTYLVNFKSEGKKHFRKLKINDRVEILDELQKQGFADVVIIEIIKI
jgi:hypothetical protein